MHLCICAPIHIYVHITLHNIYPHITLYNYITDISLYNPILVVRTRKESPEKPFIEECSAIESRGEFKVPSCLGASGFGSKQVCGSLQ